MSRALGHVGRSHLAMLAMCALLGCTPPPPGDSTTDAGGTEGDPWYAADLAPELVAARPYGLRVPSSYSGAATPLIVALHGFGSNGLQHATLSGLLDRAEERGFLLAYPDGTLVDGAHAWNASCCGTLPIDVDDVSYLRALIADAASRYSVDRRQIYLHGHSNGAFMAHLMACQASDLVAAVNTISGTMWEGEETSCQPGTPVAVLHVHGTADQTVAYEGGLFRYSLLLSFRYISATDVVALWRARNGCGATAQARTADYMDDIAGDETAVAGYAEGCAAGRTVELWTIEGGGHVPSVNDAFWGDVLDFLLGHPRPE